MPTGPKAKYTDEQKRQAEHIDESYAAVEWIPRPHSSCRQEVEVVVRNSECSLDQSVRK